jgi:predicted Zn-dependent protease
MHQIASGNEPAVLEHERSASRILLSLIVTVCPVFGACHTGSPSAPGGFNSPMMPLAPCGVLPNYVGAGLSPGTQGNLYRWERFPLQVSIDQGSLSIAGDDVRIYEDAIREGAVAWSLATNGVIGAVEIGLNVPDAHITVGLSHQDLPEQQGVTYPKNTGRVLLPGTRILLFLDPIVAEAARIELTAPNQLQPFVAKIMAHEMGHALGVLAHSPDPRDLMFGGRDWSQAAPPYPWVTESDRHTVGEAYCR